jgi:tRNA-dihydrouridine synthase A
MDQESIEKRPQISVAPMMDWTDRHCRYFHRLISPNALLYTEMVTTGALIHGDTERFLRFHEAEHPIALQLGGSDTTDLAQCSKLAQDHGYDEVNLNCGCPSDRVQHGRIGACLMDSPETVANCIDSMMQAVSIPVTVKCRIGIDDQDTQAALDDFVGAIAARGCKTFIIHARKAWLKGLSPKENRDVPPLDYDRVYKLKRDFPDLIIIINGGVKTVDDIKQHCEQLDGAMIGREAYQNAYLLAEIENKIFGNHDVKSREKIAQAMMPYIREQMDTYGTPVKSMTRHMIGLFHQQPGAKSWRQALSILPHEDGVDESVILKALDAMAR